LLWFLKKEKLVEPIKRPFFLIISGKGTKTSMEHQCIDVFLHDSLSYWKPVYQKKPLNSNA